jgi:hypothetical protein
MSGGPPGGAEGQLGAMARGGRGRRGGEGEPAVDQRRCSSASSLKGTYMFVVSPKSRKTKSAQV